MRRGLLVFACLSNYLLMMSPSAQDALRHINPENASPAQPCQAARAPVVVLRQAEKPKNFLGLRAFEPIFKV